MRLTRRQRALFEEAEAIASLTNFDFHRIEDKDIDATLGLQIAIHKMVTGEIVIRYTLLDEILADLIARYFFHSADFPKLWRTKKFSTFVHHVLDEMYLLKKMDLVHAIKPLPSDVIKAIRKINTVRNAFAHSLFPENRKEHRKNKKVLYGDRDIRTHEGLKNFLVTAHNQELVLGHVTFVLQQLFQFGLERGLCFNHRIEGLLHCGGQIICIDVLPLQFFPCHGLAPAWSDEKA